MNKMRNRRGLKHLFIWLLVLQAVYLLFSLRRSTETSTINGSETIASITPQPHTLKTSQPLTTIQARTRWVESLLSFYEANGDEQYCERSRKHLMKQLEGELQPEFMELLRSQFEMHQRVADGFPLPNQTYLIWSLSGGLGNRFQSLVSTFMLAVLSRRVLLLKDWFTPLPKNSKSNKPLIFPAPYTNDYQLEALEKLFWESNPLVNETVPRPPNDRLLCPIFPMMSLTEFYQKYPNYFQGNSGRIAPSLAGHVKIDLSARHDKSLVRWNRVACANLTEHRYDTNRPEAHHDHRYFFPEKFVYIWTNQYFLPLLYSNPYHGSKMRRLLPSKPFGTLLKLVVLPSSEVMSKVARFFHDQVQNYPVNALKPGAYLAIQARAFSYAEMNDLSNAFAFCMKQDGVSKPFYLATMHKQVRDTLVKTYGPASSRMSQVVAGDQLTGKGADPDINALVDMLLLSLSERLMVSPGSTFGTFSAAFGEVPTVRVNWKLLLQNKRESVCQKLVSHEPCFGSWYKYDHILQRSNLGSRKLTGNDIVCELVELPKHVMHC